MIPVKQRLDENEDFVNDPLCQDTIFRIIEFYEKTGFIPPWICYYVKEDGCVVGSAGFKGKPVNGAVEIAYGTVEQCRNRGIGTRICNKLVKLALKSDPSIIVTARTLKEKNHSVRILQKNNFEHVGIVNDPEDGEVWEWRLRK